MPRRYHLRLYITQGRQLQIRDATIADIYSVAVAMRERDYAEFDAVNFSNSREELASILVARYGHIASTLICVTLGGTPVAIGGLIEGRPNVVTLLFYATDRFPSVAIGVTKFIKKNLFPRIVAAGVHRIECTTLEGYENVHRWIETLGLVKETDPMLNYGKNGEAFIQFSLIVNAR